MPKSNAELDRIVSQCTDPNELRRLVRENLTKNGIVLPSPEGELGLTRNPNYVGDFSAAPVAEPPVDPSQHKCLRVIYPSGNARIEISGMSEQELDEIEKRVRASFGQ